MPSDIAAVVRERLADVIDDVPAEEVDLSRDMADDYGLTSLNKVLFLTAVCDETGVGLSNFTERDLAVMRTGQDVAEALARHAEVAA
ncbi:MAG: acyl carrier protein [Catenulispora sp.]|nr:acyl carrier protein [Catenulispora sp.]